MKNKITYFIKKGSQNKKIIQNFCYLTILQVFNLLIPLITYPYLIHVIGKGKFGLIIFAQAVISYLVILISFGFNISAIKEISVNRNDKRTIGVIVNSVFIIKFCLFVFSVLLTTLLVFIIPQAYNNKILFYLTLWMCLYELIFPTWYFQGIEEMKYITYVTFFSRLFFVILTFIMIKKESDYLLIPILNGVGAMIAGVISIYIIYCKHKIEFFIPKYIEIKKYFKESIPIFVSNLSTSLSLTTNKIILGIFIGMNEVAYYELADKISNIIKTPIHLIAQSIYPRVAFTKNPTFLRKSFYFAFIISVILLIIGLLTSNILIKLFGGNEMKDAVSIFRILLISIIPVTVSVFFANLVLIIWGFNKEFLKSRLYMNVLYFLCIGFIYLTNSVNLVSLSIVTVIIEIFVSIYVVCITKRKKINFLINY